ncbi:MAG: hypothetical protein AAGC53_08720 [Actinomycetota bacterium]
MSDRLAIALDRERRGIVERVTNPDDRRVTLVTLTDEGRALLDAAAPAHVDAVRSLVVDVLDPTELVALAAAEPTGRRAAESGERLVASDCRRRDHPRSWHRPTPVIR